MVITRRARVGATGAALLLLASGAVGAGGAVASSDHRGGNDDDHGHGHGNGNGSGKDKSASAVLRDVAGNRVGKVSMRQKGKVVQVEASVRSLTPGFHGFHVHTTGLCEAGAPAGPFTTAGGHYTGGSPSHGDHAGDLPSLLVLADGTGYLSFVTDRFTLAQLADADGSAVMVHAGRDNFANIPTRYTAGGVPGPDAATLGAGDAGSRAACGVVD